jgi:hypothetical protein
MWVSHTAVRMNAPGNCAPDKRRATQRINGTIALVMGLGMPPTAQSQSICIEALIG